MTDQFDGQPKDLEKGPATPGKEYLWQELLEHHRQGQGVGESAPNPEEMADRPEAAIQAIITGILNMQQQNLSLGDRLAVEALLEGEPQGERDQLGGTRKEARAEYLAFTRDRPTFERGQDCWEDFAVRFRGAAREYSVMEEQAKRVLYDAITGSSSRLVITSLSQELPAAQGMTFGEYLQRMGEKFMPVAESIQMEAEYRDQKQGKFEDVQNYINAKYKLFLLAFPNAQARDQRGNLSKS